MSVTELQGDPTDISGKIGIVVSRWNSFITDKLLEGALGILKNKGYAEEDIIVVRCPGAYEIPSAASRLLSKVDGVIALGAVIRGETPHFEYVCDAVNRGITDLNISSGKPLTFGVLTTETAQQANERADADSSKGNKGAEAALACLEMLSLHRKIDKI